MAQLYVLTMYAGSKGVILTDTLMFLLFTGATLVFAYYIVSDLGGIATSIENMAQLESKAGIASWSGIVGPGTEWPNGDGLPYMGIRYRYCLERSLYCRPLASRPSFDGEG